jgi:methyl-accepting chemotaxis protein
MQGPRYKRRNYLINPEFQLTVMAFFVGLAMVTIAIFYWSATMVFDNFAQTVQKLALPPDHSLVLFLADNQHAMNMIFLTTSVLLFIFLLLGGLILSHHIAGPIHRLKSHMQRVASGENFGDLNFRKKDFFQDVVPEYNKLLARVREWRNE